MALLERHVLQETSEPRSEIPSDLRDAGNEKDNAKPDSEKDQCAPREDPLKDFGGQIHAQSYRGRFPAAGGRSDNPTPKLQMG